MTVDETASKMFSLLVDFCDAVELKRDTYEAFLALEKMDKTIEEAEKIQARPQDKLDDWAVRNKCFMLRHYAREAFREVRSLEPSWGKIIALKCTIESIVSEMRWHSNKRIAGPVPDPAAN